MRVVEKSFEQYGCLFKIKEAKHVIARASTHYYGMKESYLSSYHPICPEQFNGHMIHHGQSGYFLVTNGTKRKFNSPESFQALNLSVEVAYLISNVTNFEAIPLGEPFSATSLRRTAVISSWTEYASVPPTHRDSSPSYTSTTNLLPTAFWHGCDVLYRFFATTFWKQHR